MKLMLKTAILLSTIATSAMAQVVTPVWVQHLNGQEGMSASDRLPILRKNPGGVDQSNGTSGNVGLGKLLPYDATRYLLFVRENGINEATANSADAILATNYPDRSLIWINAATGAPMGIAHRFGINPVVITGQSGQNDLFNEFGIAEDGTLYYGHRNKLLRYAKTGTDTWSSTPTCAWTEPTVGATDCDGNPLDDSVSGDQSVSFRWREFRVSGSGTNTALFCGGGTWRAGQQPQLFHTANGTNFYPAAKLNNRDNGTGKNEYGLGGQASRVVRHGLDPSRPNLETVYTGHYPGSGYGARPNRYQSDPDAPARIISPYSYTPTDSIYIYDRGEAVAGSQPAFVWEAAGKDGLPEVPTVDGTLYYDGNWSCAMDAHESLDYIVNYSMPSWNNVYGATRKPGWIGVHRLDGSIAPNSAWNLPNTEGDGNTSNWGYCGDVTLYPDTNAPGNLKKALFPWSGGVYGFGIFTVQNVGAAISSPPPTTITLNELDPLNINVGVTGSPNTYQWTKGGVPLDGSRTNANGSKYYPETVIQGPKKSNLSIVAVRTVDSGVYKLMVTNPLTGTTSTTDINVNVIPDTIPPIAQSAGSMDPSTVDICFNESLDPGGADIGSDPGTARNPANYTFLSPSGVTVNFVELRPNTKGVRLNVSGLTAGASFTVKVQGVRDYTRTVATAIPAPGQNVSGKVQTSLPAVVDIGVPAITGTTYNCKEGEYEVEAGGTDIWGSSDVFHFAYKEVTGDFDVRVQVQQVTTPGNRNGIMLRESLFEYSRFNYVTFNPGNIMGFHVRETDSTTPVWKNPEGNWANVAPAPNVWMRLKRQGNVTSAFRSTDGANWTSFGTTTNVIPDPALLGLATAANAGANPGFTRYASYGNVTLLQLTTTGGNVTLSWTGSGVLESSAAVEGPYSSSGQSQSNPQVVPTTGGTRYFRIRLP